MSNKYWLLFWLMGLVVVCVWGVSSFFSRESRLERRRRKSHSRVISKSNRPMVKFSVRPPKDRD